MPGPDDNKNPGLTPELFELDPIWFKKAFAYRLFCMLAPPAITRRLQRFLIDAAVFPGIDLPPGFVLPPGYTFPPGFSFPPGWKYGDPFPWGSWPPGFDWDDPQYSAMPPVYIAPWEPGPISRSRTSAGLVLETYLLYSELSDGYVHNVNADWQTCHDASSGTLVDSGTGGNDRSMCAQNYAPHDRYIRRSFFIFDLSSLPSRTPTEVQLKIVNPYGAHSSVSVQESTNAIPLTVAEYSAFAGSEFGHVSWITGDNLIDFNIAGQTFVKSKIGGLCKLCCREYSKDYLNVPTPDDYYFYNGCYFANNAQVSRKPALTVVL